MEHLVGWSPWQAIVPMKPPPKTGAFSSWMCVVIVIGLAEAGVATAKANPAATIIAAAMPSAQTHSLR